MSPTPPRTAKKPADHKPVKTTEEEILDLDAELDDLPELLAPEELRFAQRNELLSSTTCRSATRSVPGPRGVRRSS